jgi:chemotaxis protein histidine kinase CheA
MDSEVERLDCARYGIKVHGFTHASLEELFHAAHDIKGQAATFGFPQVAPAADSLCRLIEHTPEKERIPVTLIDQHVDAVRAIVREQSRRDSVPLADALSRRLREVTDEFLAHENRENPDLLDGVLGPPIAPGETAA